jgi:hypothetical protein
MMLNPIELTQKLAQYEDAETAIAVYREANHIISQFEEIKQAALNLAESELRSTGETSYKTAIGSCGWTQPKTRQLDKDAWQAAVADDSDLSAIQTNFNRAKSLLEKAQEPFTRLPEGRFFIK